MEFDSGCCSPPRDNHKGSFSEFSLIFLVCAWWDLWRTGLKKCSNALVSVAFRASHSRFKFFS